MTSPVSSVAKEFHYNENYLSNLIHTQTGESLVDFLQEVRVYNACTLLQTTGLPANEIGFNVGFNSTETFQRVFKKLRGLPPGEFRKGIEAAATPAVTYKASEITPNP